ncbi:MAG: hypothetical protein OEM41_08525 [Ignavibacteria bacterium]|nr:hypothetical protein [Ignavibacteria bacterium]
MYTEQMASGKTYTAHSLAGPLISRSRRNRSVLRFCLLFALYATCFIGLVGVVGVYTGLLETFSEFLAVVTGMVVNAFGIAARSTGILVIHNTGFAIEITYRCTGVLQAAFFISAVLALPYSFRTKKVPLATGTLVILAANLIRILAVYLVGVFAFPWVRLAHDVVGELFMIVVTVLAWRVGLRYMETRLHRDAPGSDVATVP